MNKKTTGQAALITSTHSKQPRNDNDFYATQPLAVELLLNMHNLSFNIWECAVGKGHISKTLEDNGYNVRKSDIVFRGVKDTEIIDFLIHEDKWNGDIVTNPPFSLALEFVEKSLNLVNDGNQVIMFLKIQFLESKARAEFFKNNPPKVIYIPHSRLNCARDGDFDKYTNSSAMFCWYVWEKGYKGNTIIKWFNP